MSAPIDIGASADFAEGELAKVTARGRDIAVVRWRGRLYALRNVCPHLGAPLCEGAVLPLLEADADLWSVPRADDGAPLVVCPWHRWEFDARTGRAIVGELRVKAFAVTERDARAYLEWS